MLIEKYLQSLCDLRILIPFFVPDSLNGRALTDQLGGHFPHSAVAITASDLPIFRLVINKGNISIVENLETLIYSIAVIRDVVGDLFCKLVVSGGIHNCKLLVIF